MADLSPEETRRWRELVQGLGNDQPVLVLVLAEAILAIDDEHLEQALSLLPPEDLDAVRRALPLDEYETWGERKEPAEEAS